ncbi:MAG: hypothetical protein V1797_01465, partial [Pseudomonadota bacterium]
KGFTSWPGQPLTAGGSSLLSLCQHAPDGKKNVWAGWLRGPGAAWRLAWSTSVTLPDIFLASQGACFLQQGQPEPVKAERSEPFGLGLDWLRRPCYFQMPSKTADRRSL